MKEKEFLEKLKEKGIENTMKEGIFYSIDDEGNIILDVKSMVEEYEDKIKEVEEILENA